MEWDKIQLQRWDDGDLWWMNGTFNAGKAESKGIEVSLKAAITDNLEFSANVNSGKAEYTEDILDTEGEISTPAGTDMPFAPDLKYWVGVDYTLPRAVFGGDMTFRLSHTYTAGSWDGRSWLDGWDDDNDVEFDPPVVRYADYLPSWGSTNATVAWYSESWAVRLQVKNLFDEKYLQSFSDGWADDIDSWYPGETRFRETAVYNRPQEITLQIRKDF